MSPAALARSLLVPALALLSALILGGLVIAFSDADSLDAWGSFLSDPLNAFAESWSAAWHAYSALLDTSLGSPSAISRTLEETTPLLLAGLSVALAFQAGLFNIGGAGQLMVGALSAAWIGFELDLPMVVHVPLALAAGALGGAVWAGIAGFLKARTGAHEVITTIMLNYIALRLLDWALSTEAYRREGRADPITPPMRESARLPALDLGGIEIGLGLMLALAATAGVWWLLNRSTVGFRMRAVGSNAAAAKYAGMSVGGTYVLAMGLAGSLTGLAGTSNLLGRPSYSLTGGFYQFIGFDAIAIALLGRAHPVGVVGGAVLFGILRAGSTGMQSQTATPVDIIVVIQALVVLFVAAPSLVRAIYRVKAPAAGEGQRFSTSWGA
ncbi:MAG: ABC transporter permease [Actinomycetota bacterium]|nr:ABC transporter permease [Actinomycetota bacterium]